jgi:hypothetical protein
MQKTPFAVGKWAREYGNNHDRVNVVWLSRNCCVVYADDNSKLTINIHDTVLTQKMTQIMQKKLEGK